MRCENIYSPANKWTQLKSRKWKMADEKLRLRSSQPASNVLIVDSEDWRFTPINVRCLFRNGKAQNRNIGSCVKSLVCEAYI